MRKTKFFYWLTTGIFAAFMLLSAIPDIMIVPDAVTIMTHLGYPHYFIPFIGVAKLLGVIAILIPGIPGLKEWAYAGLAFDLIGATYSQLSTDGFQPALFGMLLPLAFLILSYVLHQKKSHLPQGAGAQTGPGASSYKYY
jgi:DoxX-like family